jgi:hypothetical protein
LPDRFALPAEPEPQRFAGQTRLYLRRLG